MSYQVRDVFEAAQEPAPARRTSTDDIIARAQRTRIRRVAAAATAGAAAVLAMITGFALAAPAKPAGPTIAPAGQPGVALLPAESFSTALGQYKVPGYRIGPVGAVTASFQDLPVYPDGLVFPDENGKDYPHSDGTIRVYRPGVYDPKSLGSAEQTQYRVGAPADITVNGRPGIARQVSPTGSATFTLGPSTVPGDPRDTQVRTELAWQYADGAWATYTPNDLQRSEDTAAAIRIASAVTPQAPRRLKAPYALGALPGRWQVVGITQTPATVSTILSRVWLHDGPLPADQRTRSIEIDLPVASILVMPTSGLKESGDAAKDGVHCSAQRPACTIVRGGYFVEVSGPVSMTAGEVQQIVDEMTVVKDIGDQDSWVPID